MKRSLRDRLLSLFRSQKPPVITESSTLRSIERLYPCVYSFLERRYGIKVDSEEKVHSLKHFCEVHNLPPSQVLFMEIQMNERLGKVRLLTPREANELLLQDHSCDVLDVREEWETRIALLPHSQPLTPAYLDEILAKYPKEKPLLLYCHFGIRSLDAATFLADRGFTNICVLKGGIDAWSKDIDTTVPTYQEAWC